MPRDKNGLVTQGPEPFGDAANQGVVVTLWKVGAPDAARKQHVPDKGTVQTLGIKNHMARGVPRAVPHPEFFAAKLDLVTVHKPSRGHKGLGVLKPVARALGGQESSFCEDLDMGFLNSTIQCSSEGVRRKDFVVTLANDDSCSP